VQFLVANLVLGMGHVHSKNFVFRDLKPENIMVARNGYAKLIDFGFAKVHACAHMCGWVSGGVIQWLSNSADEAYFCHHYC
jgi:serine/threonine protein kinase